jgi:hypothetical protein
MPPAVKPCEAGFRAGGAFRLQPTPGGRVPHISLGVHTRTLNAVC